MAAMIEKHHVAIISVLGVVVAFFAISCATNSVICEWLFGCGGV
jgi:hypothetical protein